MIAARATIEAALDSGKLFAPIANGKWWQCRRAGATKLWKTRPNDFRIPIKFGFRGTGAIYQYNTQLFRIADSREEAERGFDRHGERS